MAMATATLRLVAALLAQAATPVVATVRCLARGQYQSEPLVFSCHSSDFNAHEFARENTFMHLVPAGQTVKVIEVPIGTVNFSITMSALHVRQSPPAQLLLKDPSRGITISRDDLTKVDLPKGYQDNLWNGTWKVKNEATWKRSKELGKQVFTEQRISLWEHLSAPRSQQVILHDETLGPMQIMVKNLQAKEDVIVRFKHISYGTRTTGPMCGIGKLAAGCSPYDQTLARQAVVEFCKGVKETYPNPEIAWSEIARAGNFGHNGKGADSVPQYMWCKIWAMFSKYHSMCWQAYKYITHGGFETNTKAVKKEDIDYCYKLPKIDIFSQECCSYLRTQYDNGTQAYAAQAKKAQDENLCVPCGEGLLKMCSSSYASNGVELPNGTTKQRLKDYVDDFLDADGYQGLLPHDLDYCWHPPQLPAPTDTADAVGVGIGDGSSGWRPEPASTTEDDGSSGWIGGMPPTTTEYIPPWATTGQATAETGRRRFTYIRATRAPWAPPSAPGGLPGVPAITTTWGADSLPTAGPTPEPTVGPIDPTSAPSEPAKVATASAVNCRFEPVEKCVKRFNYKGTWVDGCSTSDLPAHKQDSAWCSHTESYQTDPTFTTGWSWCSWKCESSYECSYKPHPKCVAGFNFQGKAQPTCTKAGGTSAAWCSKDAQFVGRWHYCVWDCPCYWKPKPDCVASFHYENNLITGCTDLDHHEQWCSKADPYDRKTMGVNKWRTCDRECPQDKSTKLIPDKKVTHTATTCGFVAPEACAHSFNYKGKNYVGCTTDDHTGGWCSRSKAYNGEWEHCQWKCKAPVKCLWQAAQGCVPFTYKGQSFDRCTPPGVGDNPNEKPWCSGNAVYAGWKKECTWDCPCYFTPHFECALSFSYKGKKYEGCTTEGSMTGRGWCSTTESYEGKYRDCGWTCPKDEHVEAGAGAAGYYALIGAGAGAGAAALGGAIYGIVKATETKGAPSSAAPQPRLASGTASTFSAQQPQPGFASGAASAFSAQHPQPRLASSAADPAERLAMMGKQVPQGGASKDATWDRFAGSLPLLLLAMGIVVCACCCAGVLLAIFLVRRSSAKQRETELVPPHSMNYWQQQAEDHRPLMSADC